MTVTICQDTELNGWEARLVEAAKRACDTGYTPYSHFRVGAAVLLENGETVTGSNQENASYTVGTCAERCTMFYANARYPGVRAEAMAIAARTEDGDFLTAPITPCGACRQVLLEIEQRQGTPLIVLLYGKKCVYRLERVADLLPLHFDGDALEDK